MGNHSQADGLGAKLFGCRGSADAAAILAAGMFRDLGRFCCRTAGILLADRAGKRGDKLMILELAALGGSCLSPGPYFRVRQ